MSLSPQDFKDSIGTASNNLGSLLVYRDRLVGLGPCGCDGWPLSEGGGMIFSSGQIHPPP